jgi:hypothetical protein
VVSSNGENGAHLCMQERWWRRGVVKRRKRNHIRLAFACEGGGVGVALWKCENGGVASSKDENEATSGSLLHAMEVVWVWCC